MKNMQSSLDSAHSEAIDWLLRIRSEKCTRSERRAFEDWLKQSDSHRQAYEAIEAQWQWMEPFKTMKFPARNAALRYRARSRRSLFMYGAAASILLVLGLSALNQNGWLGVTETYSVEKGGHKIIDLADGSSIELNTDSEARVHLDHWRRRVEMVKGEAFFKVKHDEERPFEVRAGKGFIRDIGTEFDVYVKSEQVIVAVQEGMVEVEGLEKRRLTEGQQIALSDRGEFQALQGSDVASVTAWRKGQLIFRNRRLDDVLSELGRYHDIRIRLQNRALGEMRVSGTFHIAELDDTLNAISAILPVKADYIGKHEVLLKSSAHPSG